MSVQRSALTHSTNSTSVADLLERVLDKGIVIAGDIRIKLVDIELLTIQLRLVVCSVDKAREIGIDWWSNNAMFAGLSNQAPAPGPALPAGSDGALSPALPARGFEAFPAAIPQGIEDRLARLETLLTQKFEPAG